MNISTRRKLGSALITVSVLSMAVFLVVGLVRGRWRVDGSGTSGNVQLIAGSVELGVSAYYLIPIFLCAAVGAFFLIRPSRKPPKLPS